MYDTQVNFLFWPLVNIHGKCGVEKQKTKQIQKISTRAPK
jgi:hypothetical protein